MVHEQSSGNHHHHHQQQLPRFGARAGAGAATGVSRPSKKSKVNKAPQRGLGVAQLEKLRMEEQKKMEGAATAMSVSGAAHLGGAGGGLGHLLPMHPPPPPPPLSLSALPRPGADGGGVHCGYPPVLWDPSSADPMKNLYKRSLCSQPSLPSVSTGLSLTASSSHPTEPPSNQMYSSSSSSVCRSSAAAPAPADDEREAAGVDRSWPFMFEGLNTTAFRTTMGKAPFAPRTTREAAAGLPDVCPDLSRYEFRASNYLSSNASYSDWPSEFGHCKSSKDSEAAYLTLNAQPTPRMKSQQPPALPPIHLPEFGDFGVMQSQHGSASASSSSRPFYSFMPVGPVRCERPLSEIKADASDGVDLELKL
ncbi:hypothetical protein BDA96_03G023200 [Sorghum bicolor]|uniref:Uncharacterized protein n=1 Tax=Sorghum bicolor TaxID=4558 RepID=A0A921R8T2_SORBI|nr:hypothetical protein BDA96_03G023200 [Sorghum bicolor]